MKQLILAVPFLAAIGCTSSATDTRPPISELKPGLNMIDIEDPSWGVDAAYVKDGHVVYLEERLGAMKPQVYRDAAPDEIDIATAIDRFGANLHRSRSAACERPSASRART